MREYRQLPLPKKISADLFSEIFILPSTKRDVLNTFVALAALSHELFHVSPLINIIISHPIY